MEGYDLYETERYLITQRIVSSCLGYKCASMWEYRLFCEIRILNSDLVTKDFVPANCTSANILANCVVPRYICI